jgi:hypothetical protein
MSTTSNPDWRAEFGIVDAGQKSFFASKAELNTPSADASQAHILRRAFDLLKLDGILCTENTPLVYFKLVKRIEAAELAKLHHKFWNHGGAPVLVLISPSEVHIYSGLQRPAPQGGSNATAPGLVEILDRTSSAIREFLPSVESGEFFRKHEKSFNPAHRVDRDLLDNLQATREKINATSSGTLDAKVLDALLCRVVFACYLFDRDVVGENYLRQIGLRRGSHLRDVLGLQPRSVAKNYLYELFRRLGRDFNGDLFSDDLNAEARLVSVAHIGLLDDFFRATDVLSGQQSFWPYDFAAIPVETISAIYERFLKDSEKQEGAFYTPRFLAELVLDVALAGTPALLDHRYLDPACGSGIFLVGLFNRMAEEWKGMNPEARNDRRARELRKILCSNVCGIDINPTACRITAFSLYLAYLDQLSPRDIKELQEKGHKLPRLIHDPEDSSGREVEGSIWRGDFFAEDAKYPIDADLVIGNPPWGSTAAEDTLASKWCAHPGHRYPIPDKQIAAAFVWKSVHHIGAKGHVCFVLPHGTLFNRSKTALAFQRRLLTEHAVDRVLNLADYQRFLFEEAGHPALVIAYQKAAPKNDTHPIEYLAPKFDWLVTRAEVVAIGPEDRSTLRVGQVWLDLDGADAPQIWKQRYWATSRDRRLIDRLSLYPRLRDHVRQTKEIAPGKPWVMAVGVQSVGENDDPAKAETIQLPSRLFIEATSNHIDLFLLPSDCTKLPAAEFTVRGGSNKATDVFRGPHVLVKEGFANAAFAEFDVSFLFSVRGISGPEMDRDQLIFLAVYLRSALARYFLFHTSSSWGISRQRVGVDELLRLPFPLPHVLDDPRRGEDIISEVSRIVKEASEKANKEFTDREGLIGAATKAIDPLLDEYFDIVATEKALIDDTGRIVIPSARPTRKRRIVPTVEPSKEKQRADYTKMLCDTLNGWAGNGRFVVHGEAMASAELGIAVAVLRKVQADTMQSAPTRNPKDLLAALDRLRKVTSRSLNTFQLIRGAKVFDRDRLYVIKPIGQRFWTQTAALNDADEIAGTVLMHTPPRALW